MNIQQYLPQYNCCVINDIVNVAFGKYFTGYLDKSQTLIFLDA